MNLPILDVPVAVNDYEQLIATLLDWAGQPARRFVSTCTVYTVMMARDNPAVRDALLGADMCRDGRCLYCPAKNMD